MSLPDSGRLRRPVRVNYLGIELPAGTIICNIGPDDPDEPDGPVCIGWALLEIGSVQVTCHVGDLDLDSP